MEALLAKAEAQVHLDARRPGVRLPERFLGQGNLRLDYGYHFTPPIPDLRFDDEGIHATLSFNRMPFQTFVPWSAVFLVADFDGNGAVWQDDIPQDVLDAYAQKSGPRVVDEPAPEPAPAKKPRPSHLRLVK